MLDLNGTPILVLAVLGALAALAAAVLVASLRAGPSSARRRALARAVPVAVLVVLAQVFAMSALALKVNDQYLFYTSWADLTGHVSQASSIRTGGLVGRGQGRVEVVTVHAQGAGRDHQVLIWLPAQYSEPAYRTHRFPVVTFLAGQPSSPQIAFHQFDFAGKAQKEINDHRVAPFVGVFPTLMVSPPRDTECTNVPGGPRAESWLARDVPAFVQHHLRVQPTGPAWSVMGWSTGGFCAAKLVASDPGTFGSAVSFGGYYQPLQDHTTGSLFGGRAKVRMENSPQWLYHRNGGLRGSRLLVVAGQQDRETWASTQRMLRLGAGDPSVAHVAFPQGGHNYRNYASYLASGLDWAARSWPRAAGA